MQKNHILTRTVLRWCERQGVAFSGKTLLCALSGGRDSMAMLHVLLELSAREGFAVAAAHYNHCLRESAARDEKLVREHCSALGIPLVVDSGDVRAYACQQGTSVEDAARRMRYDFLQRAADECGADYIVTAHHRQDNAETLLLHLLRGSGLNGLGGIAPVRGNIIRPLLDADRAEINAYIQEYHIPYAEDETNQDARYTRNRLRLELLPLLEEIAPGSVGRIADTAVRLREDEEYLREQCTARIAHSETADRVCISASQLSAQHRAIAARAVRAAAQKLGAQLTSAQTEAVLSLRSGSCVALGGALRAANEHGQLQFFRVREPQVPMKLSLTEKIQRWGEWCVQLRETADEIEEDANTIILRSGLSEIGIAAWDGTGRLGVGNGRRTVKRLLIDHGVGASQRENRPAIYVDGVLAAVLGAGTDPAFAPLPDEKKLVITLIAIDRTEKGVAPLDGNIDGLVLHVQKSKE